MSKKDILIIEDDKAIIRIMELELDCVEKIAVGNCNVICIEKEITDAKQ